MMRPDRAVLPVPIRLLPLAGLLGAVPAASAAEIRLVPGDSVQAAIDAPTTTEGDVLVLAPGRYEGTIDLRGRAVVIRSEAPDDPDVVAATILDGRGEGTVVTAWSGETAATVLDGLTITGGYGMSGGGMYVDGASPTVRRCVFIENHAVFDGGGVMVLLGGPLVTHCRFVANEAQYGGGVSLLDGTPRVVNCLFAGNVASASGGGIDLLFTDHAEITGCTLASNVAGRGGAISCDTSAPTIANGVLFGNLAIVAGDEVSNVYGSAPAFAHCLVAGSGGSAAWDPSTGVDLGGNLDGDPGFVDAVGADGARGTLDDDLALQRGSPCLDAGADARVPSDASDLDGDGDVLEPVPVDLRGGSRLMDDPEVGDGTTVVDMGAIEFASLATRSCAGDLDGDRTVGATDLVALVHAWGPCPGCAADLDDDGRVTFADLLDLLAQWGSCDAGADAAPARGRSAGAAPRSAGRRR